MSKSGCTLKRGDQFSDKHGSWEVIQVHPPQGRRFHWLYTILNTETSFAELVTEPDLLAKENGLELTQKEK